MILSHYTKIKETSTQPQPHYLCMFLYLLQVCHEMYLETSMDI